MASSGPQDELDTSGFAVSLLGKWEEQLPIASALGGQCCLSCTASLSRTGKLIEKLRDAFLSSQGDPGRVDLGR